MSVNTDKRLSIFENRHKYSLYLDIIMNKHKSRLFLIMVFIASVILGPGCASNEWKKHALEIEQGEKNVSGSIPSEYVLGTGDTVDITAFRLKTSESIVGVGDSIAVNVYRNNASEFLLGPGDTLDIAIFRHSDLDRTVLVDSSGNISLPLIGDVKAAGLEAGRLKNDITRELSAYIVNPQVTVDVTSKQDLVVEDLSLEFDVTAEKKGRIMFPVIGEVVAAGRTVVEIRDEIQQRLSGYIVNPQVEINHTPMEDPEIEELTLSSTVDYRGIITLPIIGDFHAAGKGLAQCRKELEQKLARNLVEAQVVLSVSDMKSQKYSVVGEIEEPGISLMDGQTTLFEALLEAGWFTDDANQENVFLLRAVNGNQVNMRVFDLKNKLDSTALANTFYLNKGDVIYVPPLTIANIEDFLQRIDTMLGTLLKLESTIVIWPEMMDVLQGKTRNTNITVGN